MQNLKRACAYVRVSKEKEDGVSPEQQLQKAELQAKLMNIDLVKVYEDLDFSGRDASKRPAFQQMIKDVQARQYDIVIAYKLDRFSRNVLDFHRYMQILEQAGCTFISISQNIDTSSPSGRLLRNILADFAQFESEMIGERVRDNLRTIARKGRPTGGNEPFGYHYDTTLKKYSINEAEAPGVRLAFEMRAAGKGYLAIAKELNARGYHPKKGGKWGTIFSEDSTKWIIKNSKYYGAQSYDDILVLDALPAIVSKELYDQAQRVSVITNRAQGADHLLTGLFYCHACALAAFEVARNGRAYNSRGKRQERVWRYICRTKRLKGTAACSSRLLDKPSLEERVAREVFSLADGSQVEQAKKAVLEAAATTETKRDNGQAEGDLKKVRALMRELFADYYDHRIITREQFQTKNSEYLQREETLLSILEEEGARSSFLEQKLLDLDLLASHAVRLRENWEYMTPAEKRMAIRQVVRQIEVHPDRVEIDIFGIKKEITPVKVTSATLYF